MLTVVNDNLGAEWFSMQNVIVINETFIGLKVAWIKHELMRANCLYLNYLWSGTKMGQYCGNGFFSGLSLTCFRNHGECFHFVELCFKSIQQELSLVQGWCSCELVSIHLKKLFSLIYQAFNTDLQLLPSSLWKHEMGTTGSFKYFIISSTYLQLCLSTQYAV